MGVWWKKLMIFMLYLQGDFDTSSLLVLLSVTNSKLNNMWHQNFQNISHSITGIVVSISTLPMLLKVSLC